MYRLGQGSSGTLQTSLRNCNPILKTFMTWVTPNTASGDTKERGASIQWSTKPRSSRESGGNRDGGTRHFSPVITQPESGSLLRSDGARTGKSVLLAGWKNHRLTAATQS